MGRAGRQRARRPEPPAADLVFWPTADGGLPVAVVVVQGQSNPRRERAALEGWQASIATGRYAQVRYLAGPAAASHLGRLATGIGLTAAQFIAAERVVTDEALVLASVMENVDEASVAVETERVPDPDYPRPSPEHAVPQRWATEEPVEAPEQAEERQKLINDVLSRGEQHAGGAGDWERRSDRAQGRPDCRGHARIFADASYAAGDSPLGRDGRLAGCLGACQDRRTLA